MMTREKNRKKVTSEEVKGGSPRKREEKKGSAKYGWTERNGGVVSGPIQASMRRR